MKHLKDFINEATTTKFTDNLPKNGVFPNFTFEFREICKLIENNKDIDWDDYYTDDKLKHVENIKQVFSFIVNNSSVYTEFLGNIDPDYLDEMLEETDIDTSKGGFLIHTDGDDGDFTIIEFSKKPSSKDKKVWNEIYKHLYNAYNIVEQF